MSQPNNQSFNHISLMAKRVAITVFFALLIGSLPTSPVVVAAQPAVAPTTPKTPNNDEQLAQTLDQIERTLHHIERKLNRKHSAANEKKTLKGLHQSLNAQDQKAIQDFKAIEQRIKAKNLPAVIMERHQKAVTRYTTKMATLKANLEVLENAKDKTAHAQALTKAISHLTQAKKKEKRKPHDPKHNPHRALQPKKNNKPKTNKKAFHTAGLFDTPYVKLAAHGNFDLSQLPGADDPAYLSETPEIRITQAIKDAATALDHNPVEIYKWIYHKTEWVPTWGSIQNTDYTLLTRKGNAFDLASLLIALYRVSGIPARYVHGTIQVPAERFMNWAGGFKSPEGALDYVASAGLPVSSVVSGGKIVAFRLEHVWVEAAIDFNPSRGALNKAADTWIRVDPSFKQYQPEYGYDMYSMLNFNGKDHIKQYFADTRDLTPYQFYSRRVLDYLNAQKPNWTLLDLYGYERVAPIKEVTFNNFSLLAASLPYDILVKGYTSHTVFDQLRAKITVAIANNLANGVDAIYSISLPELAARRLTLSYVPDDYSGDAVFNDYTTLYSQPAYLTRLKPQLRLDGAVVATGNSIDLGDKINLVIDIQSPSLRGAPIHNEITAGAYSALVIQGSESERTLTGSNMSRLADAIKANVSNPEDLDNLLGQLLHENAHMWFFNMLYERDFYATTIGVRYAMLPSVAIATADLSVRYFLGIPKSVSLGYYSIDADQDVAAIGAIDGNQTRKIDFMYLYGMTGSAWEHLVNEGAFNETSISSIKVLKTAARNNIPIYYIDQSNFNSIYPLLSLDADDLADIKNMVSAGFYVIVPERNLTINSWRGAALIALDPNSGGGPYLISGGLSGGSTTADSPEEWIEDTYDLGRFETLLRSEIIMWAESLLLTPYGLGCKDPYDPKPVKIALLGPEDERYTCFKGIDENGDPIPYDFAIDCSGLVAYAYSMVGFPFFDGLSAEGQRSLVGSIGEIPTVPILGDLRFWIGGPTWKPGRIGHVGITLNQNQWIAAQGTEVGVYSSIGLTFDSYGSVLKKHYVIP